MKYEKEAKRVTGYYLKCSRDFIRRTRREEELPPTTTVLVEALAAERLALEDSMDKTGGVHTSAQAKATSRIGAESGDKGARSPDNHKE